MSAYGTKRTSQDVGPFVRFRAKADIHARVASTASVVNDPGCVKTHTSAKCRKHNSPARHRTSRVQYDLTLRDAIARRYFYVWRDRWSFRTAKTQSGHWQDLNPAVQRSPTIGYLGKIQNNSGLSQGLCGRTARHSCYGVNSQNRSSRREREHGSWQGLFEFKERRALVLLRRGSAYGRFRTRRRRPQSSR